MTSSPDSAEAFAEQPLGEFLDGLAAPTPAPGGGAAAAISVALAGALTAMAARLSVAQVDEAETLAADADALRRRATALAHADGAAYSAFRAAQRGTPGESKPPRREAIRMALVGATEVPLAIAEAGARVAAVAGRVAAEGNPNVAGDAATAAFLAEAATRSAAALVELNVASGRLKGPWTERAQAAVAEATAVAGRVDAGLRAGTKDNFVP